MSDYISASDSEDSSDDNFDRSVFEYEHKIDPPTDQLWAAPPPSTYLMGTSSHDSRSSDARDTHFAVYSQAQISSSAVDAIGGPWFRFLQIRPSQPDQPILADLVSRPVFDAPPYIALSYSWGSHSTGNTEIFIGKAATPFAVSGHLWSAIQRLRDTQEVVCVWVDAVCINQQNLLEKAAQVQIMAQIYSMAAEVRIWLGNVKDQCKKNDMEIFSFLCQQEKPWWRRLWVLQECAYAERCPVVMLGDSCTTLQEFVQRWANTSSNQVDQQEILKENLEFLRMPYRIWKEQSQMNGLRMPLLQRLRETADREFSDPRDRIYALLNLTQESEAQVFPPDYRKPYYELREEVERVLRKSVEWDEDRDKSILELRLPLEAQTLLTDFQTASSNRDSKLLQNLYHKNADLLRLIDQHYWSPPSIATRLDAHFLNEAFHTSDLRVLNDMLGLILRPACETGKMYWVRLLIAAGASVNVRSHDGFTVLSIASYKGHEEMVRLLLDEGSIVNDLRIGRVTGSSALLLAAGGGHQQVMRMLLKAGAEANVVVRNHKERSCVTLSVARDLQKDLKKMSLIVAFSAGHYVTIGGSTRISTEPERAHLDVASILRDIGVDTIIEPGYYADCNYQSIVESLLDADAGVSSENGHYPVDNALGVASLKDQEWVVEQLHSRGARTLTYSFNDLLGLAVLYRKGNVLELLL